MYDAAENARTTFIQEYNVPSKLCDDLITYFNDNKDKQIEGLSMGGVDASIKESTDLGISPHFDEEPIKTYRDELQSCLDVYCKDYPETKSLHHFNITEGFNIQYYKPNQGYKIRHAERNGTPDKTLKRCLVFMTYLNDVPDGGTFFTVYKKLIRAEKGKTLIWPSDWTHTHIGQISPTTEKYILTGWFSYTWMLEL